MSRDGGRRSDVDDVRDQLADDLGVDSDQIGIQERTDRLETRLRDEGRETVREDLAGDDDFVEPDDIEIRDDGPDIDFGISEAGQERIDDRRFESISDELPAEDDILLSLREESTAPESVVIDLRQELESGDLGTQADIGSVVGTNVNIPRSPTEIIRRADPETAEDLLGIDAAEIEEAQDELDRRQETLEQDPEAFRQAALEDPSQLLEPATAIERGLQSGRLRRSEIRDFESDLAAEISDAEDDVDPDDVDVRVDSRSGDADISIDGRSPASFREQQERQRLASDFDEETQISIGPSDITIEDGSARLTDDAQDRQIDAQRADFADEVGVEPADIAFDAEDEQFTLTEDALEQRRGDEEEELQQQLIEDLDEDFPGVDITEDDVDFEIDGDEISAELTDGALRDIERQASLLSDFEVDISDIRTGSGAAGSAFVGTETAQTGIPDPLRDAQPQGLAVGDTQIIGVGEDLPDSTEELGDVEFGSDELLTTDLPTSVREAAPIVRETSRDIARAPAERAVGATIQRGMDARDLVSGDLDELVDSTAGQTAVAAGAAGIAAPEPATTVGGAAVAGGAILGGAALDVSRRGEIDIDPRDVEQDQSELEAGDPRATTSELEAGRPRRETIEVTRPTSPEPVSAEIDTPQTGDVVDGSEIGVPRIEAQQATGIQREDSLVGDIDELLDEEEADRLRREELSETARQQQEQQIFEQRRDFGEIERETIPERDRFDPIDIDDIGEGIAGRGEPETFGERDETFAERFDRIIEERQQEEQQRFFEQQESVVTTRPGDQQTGDVATPEDQTAATGFFGPAASQASLNLPIGGVDDITDTAADSDVDDGGDFGTEPRTTETTATGQQPAFDTAQPTAIDATTEPALAAETAVNQAVETVDPTVQQPAFAEPTVTQTAAQTGQQGQQTPRIPRPDLPETDGEFGDDELDWFDVIDERVVRDLDDPDFIAGVDDIDPALDIPDTTEGL